MVLAGFGGWRGCRARSLFDVPVVVRRGAVVFAVPVVAALTGGTAVTPPVPVGASVSAGSGGVVTLSDGAWESLALNARVVVPAGAAFTLGVVEVSSAPPPPPPSPVTVALDVEAGPSPVVAASSRAGVRSAEAPAVTGVDGGGGVSPDAAPSGFGDRVVDVAVRYVGVPYVWGGASPAGFDCSGFTQFVFAQVGVTIPRTSAGQHSLGGVVPAGEARPGDLMTWDGHAGIYLGGGSHIAARSPGTPLMVSPIYREGARFHRLG